MSKCLQINIYWNKVYLKTVLLSRSLPVRKESNQFNYKHPACVTSNICDCYKYKTADSIGNNQQTADSLFLSNLKHP